MHKSDDAAGIGRDGWMDAGAGAGVAGQELSYYRNPSYLAVAQAVSLSLHRNSVCCSTYTYYSPLLEHTFTRHSSAIASHTTCSVKCMQRCAHPANNNNEWQAEAGRGWPLAVAAAASSIAGFVRWKVTRAREGDGDAPITP